MVLDHAPQPGPGYWEWRCLYCGKKVAEHGSAIARIRWRREQRKRIKKLKAANPKAHVIPGFLE